MSNIQSGVPIQLTPVIDESGTAKFSDAVYSPVPAGVEIVGVGTADHPFTVKLSPDYLSAERIGKIVRGMWNTYAREMVVEGDMNGADAVDYFSEKLREIREALEIPIGDWSRCSDCEFPWLVSSLLPLDAAWLEENDPPEPGHTGVCPDCSAACYPIPKNELLIKDST